MLNNSSYTPIQTIETPLLAEKKVQLLLKRDDEIHPEISGNKWRKLKYNLLAAKAQQLDTLVTFGGAFSNHIAATAAAGKTFGFKTIGIIRGERIMPLNPTLALAERCGMNFHFVDRTTYRNADRFALAQQLCEQPFYFLPEGGTNALAREGCAEIVAEMRTQLVDLPDYVTVACGTGGTIAGIIEGLKEESKVIGFSALKGDFLKDEVAALLPTSYMNWQINTDYHFGGYAKWKSPLIDFINQFKQTQGVSLEPIYTAKMLYGIFDMIQNDHFSIGTSILAVHTGGLQGIRGFNQRFGNLIEV
ncbi:MAG: pyridoxal-phosphate dependent enzyme [Bacteroidota bacterium]